MRKCPSADVTYFKVASEVTLRGGICWQTVHSLSVQLALLWVIFYIGIYVYIWTRFYFAICNYRVSTPYLKCLELEMLQNFEHLHILYWTRISNPEIQNPKSSKFLKLSSIVSVIKSFRFWNISDFGVLSQEYSAHAWNMKACFNILKEIENLQLSGSLINKQTSLYLGLRLTPSLLSPAPLWQQCGCMTSLIQLNQGTASGWDSGWLHKTQLHHDLGWVTQHFKLPDVSSRGWICASIIRLTRNSILINICNINSSSGHTQSPRKIHTMQGFCQPLTPPTEAISHRIYIGKDSREAGETRRNVYHTHLCCAVQSGDLFHGTHFLLRKKNPWHYQVYPSHGFCAGNG